MMTCANCKHWENCDDTSKSDKVSEEGDSHACYCDDFIAKEGRTEAHKNGYTAIQSGRCGYDFVIFDDSTGKWVMHCLCRSHQTEQDLEKMIDIYIDAAKRGFRFDESDTEAE